MKNQKVVIIGGTSGMGLATAQAALGEGFEVIIAGRNKEKLDTAFQSVPSASGGIVDARDSASLEAFFSGVGPFDHLVLSLSGNKGFGMFKDLAIDDVEKGFSEKTIAQLRSAQTALPSIDENGSITFISAASAQASLPGTSGYAAINGALERMVPPLARELGPIRVNAVSPGVIDTPWWDFMGDMKKDIFAQTEGGLPVHRIGAPQDIASVVMMLIKNGFITGSILVADGGGHLL